MNPNAYPRGRWTSTPTPRLTPPEAQSFPESREGNARLSELFWSPVETNLVSEANRKIDALIQVRISITATES